MSINRHLHLRAALSRIRKPRYTSSHIAVLESLADRINDKTGICFPSMARIAEEAYISERYARNIVRQLEADGIVRVTHRDRRTSIYSLDLPASPGFLATPATTPDGEAPDDAEAVSEAEMAGLEHHEIGLDDRRTSNSNQSLNAVNEPVRDVNVSLRRERVSLTRTSDEGDGTGNPVPTSPKQKEMSASRATAASLCEVLNRTASEEDFTPSRTDLELLQLLIETHGEDAVRETMRYVLKGKNPYWRERMKNCDFPCSLFANSFIVMREQIEKIAEQCRIRAAKKKRWN